MNTFFQERCNELATELEELREKYRTVSTKLSEAELTLKYYGNPQVYELSPPENGTQFQDRLVGDREAADNTPSVRVAGLRARLYFKKYAE